MALISVSCALLPALGMLWLIEQGAVELWLMLMAGLIAVLALLRLRHRQRTPGVLIPGASAAAAAAEVQARSALATLAGEVSAEDLATREAAEQLLRRIVTAVATAYAPDDEAAVLNFTLPEVLRMTEEVARRLRRILSEQLPVLRHLRLSWAARSGGLIERGLGPARGLVTAWRVARWVDPLGALIAEVRSLVIEQGVTLLGREARALLAATLVREVGTVAIELYSGAYRQAVSDPGDADHEPPPDAPLRVLVAGQRNTGKSSLINALLGRERAAVGLTQTTTDWTSYPGPPLDIQRPWVLIDSPPLGARSAAAWLAAAGDADLVLWVAAAHRADRAADQEALKALRALSDQDPTLRPLPVLLVLTHADRLEPPLEWQPPYDPLNGTRVKELNMARAMQAAARALGVPLEQVLVLALGEARAPWNLPALYSHLEQLWPQAAQKRLQRLRRAAGLVKTGVDLVRSLPGALGRARDFLRR